MSVHVKEINTQRNSNRRKETDEWVELFSRVWLIVTPQTVQPKEFSGQNTGVGSLSLLQGIFPTKGLNSDLLHFRQILSCLSHVGSLFFFSSVAQLYPTVCDLMDCSMPGFPVHHQLLEPAQTRPSSRWCHPTISSSFNPFSSCLLSFPASRSFLMRTHQVAKVLEPQLQYPSFQWIFRTDFP